MAISRALLPWAALAALASCEDRDAVVQRKGQPDFVQKFDKGRMDRAIAEAKSTFGDFVKALEEKRPGTSNFTLKKGFKTSDGSQEFIWISDVRAAAGGFEGEINNEPVDVKSLKLGQVVRVSREDAVDWMYQERGKLRGGYTIVALVHGTPEQASYEKSMGIDWSAYRFLKR
jgi:uncharacterized protein YegJ (DUF2314 family)